MQFVFGVTFELWLIGWKKERVIYFYCPFFRPLSRVLPVWMGLFQFRWVFARHYFGGVLAMDRLVVLRKHLASTKEQTESRNPGFRYFTGLSCECLSEDRNLCVAVAFKICQSRLKSNIYGVGFDKSMLI